MNKAELSELRARLNPDKQHITRIRGCYVNDERRILALFNVEPLLLPEEETTKYLALFKRVLSGLSGKNLLDVEFSAKQVMESEEHRLLTALRDCALGDDEAVQAFYHRVIEHTELEGNYLILLLHDVYPVPFRGRDELKVEQASDTRDFPYLLCAVCPVKQSRPALSYYANDQEFHSRMEDWVVAAPELGFLFPAFDNRAANIYGALYYTRDSAEPHDDFYLSVFNTEMSMPAAEQKEVFQAILGDALKDDCSYEVAQALHERVTAVVDERKKDKAAEPPTISKREVKSVLESCGVPTERVAAFEKEYDETFGAAAALGAQNIVNVKKFEMRTADVVINVNPERSDLIETRVIDGLKYILIRADEGVQVNGMNVRIEQ